MGRCSASHPMAVLFIPKMATFSRHTHTRMVGLMLDQNRPIKT